MISYLRRLSRNIHIEHSHSLRALGLPSKANFVHYLGLPLEWPQTATKGCVVDIFAEPGYQVPVAITVEVAATRRLHVGKSNGLKHGHTTSMISHVLDIDPVQVLAHADQIGECPPSEYPACDQ